MSRWRFMLAWALVLPAIAWGVGQVASDRWWWSQWLFWIPAAVPLLCAAGAAALIWRGPRSRQAATRGNASGPVSSVRMPSIALQVAVCAAVAATGISTLRWISWGRAASDAEARVPSALRIVHLNARWPGNATALGARLMAQPADVHAISEAGALLSAPAVRAAADAGAVTMQVGRFAIVSRCPVREARAIYDDGSIAASWVRFGASGAWPEWSMLMVDAPRHLRLSRDEIFGKLHAALEAMSMGSPDVVVGDLNTTPGSAAVARAWPQMEDACTSGGRGLRATFPREFPLWAIDRCLVTPRWQAIEWSAWDPGIGAHRGQRITLDPMPVSP
jgi:hypothetical protein